MADSPKNLLDLLDLLSDAPRKEVYVFSSNEAGRHGKGSALAARRKYGAIYGQSQGLQGNSYAIPTKDKFLRPLTLSKIAVYISQFVEFAKLNPLMTFNVVKIGCGLAGFTEDQIAPLFRGAPENVRLPDGWRNYQ